MFDKGKSFEEELSWLAHLKEDVEKMAKRSKEFDLFSFSHTEDFHNVITSSLNLIPEKEAHKEMKGKVFTKTTKIKTDTHMDSFKSKSQPKMLTLKPVKPPKSLFITSANVGQDTFNKSRFQTLNSSMAGDRTKFFVEELSKSKLRNLQARDFLPHLKREINAHTDNEIKALKKQRDSMRKQLDRLSYQKF